MHAVESAGELAGRYADDGGLGDDFANDMGVGAEALPAGPRHDGNAAGTLILAGGEKAAEEGLKAEHGEVIFRDRPRDDADLAACEVEISVDADRVGGGGDVG